MIRNNSLRSAHRLRAYSRRHVLCKITPPSPLHITLGPCVTPKSKLYAFVDFTAMSAHSVHSVRDKSGDIQARRKYQSAHTSTEIVVCTRVMSIWIRSQVRGCLHSTSHTLPSSPSRPHAPDTPSPALSPATLHHPLPPAGTPATPSFVLGCNISYPVASPHLNDMW